MLFVLFGLLLFVTNHEVSAGADYERISGKSRIDTAIEISQKGWAYLTEAEEKAVILARADNPADALAAASLSGVKDAPILLTYPNEIEPAVLKEIKRLETKFTY